LSNALWPCLLPSSALLGVRRTPERVSRPGLFSTAGPPHRLDAGSFHLELDPLQRTHDQRATQPVSWVDFPGFPIPFNGTIRASPALRVGVPPHSGSALRFSQPPSGFLASSNSTGLFRPATVPRLLPSESSPRRNRAPLSRPLAPSQFSTDTIERAAHVPSLGVSPTPTPESAVAWIPTVATTAFPQALATDQFPGLP